MAAEHEEKGQEAVIYEIGFHLVPSLGEETAALRAGEIRSLLEEKGGAVLHEGTPEHMRLAYTMRKQIAGAYEKYDNAYFGWVKFTLQPALVAEVKEALDAHEEVIRYIIVKTNGEAYKPTEKKNERGEEPIEAKGVGASGAGDKADVSEEELEKAVDDIVSDEKKEDEGADEKKEA